MKDAKTQEKLAAASGREKRIALAKERENGIIQTGGKYKVDSEKWFKRIKLLDEKVVKYYEQVRADKTDIYKITINADMSKDDIIRIQNHIFFDGHIMYDGKVSRLQPDYDIAVAWERLKNGEQTIRDILLLKHELEETKIEGKMQMPLSVAHNKANEKNN